MTPVRVGLIGCGSIGPTHIAGIALDSRARMDVVCDLDAARLQAMASGIRHVADWRQVVADPAIDLVIVATPHHLHADMACAVLAAGKHLWLEKPLATTPADVARILAAARASRKIAAGVFQHRYTPLVARLHALVAEGHFGAVEEVALAFRCTRNAAYYASGAWRGRWDQEGGALLINQGIHHIDLAQWFAGTPLTVSGRVERRKMAIECEDTANLEVACQGGARLSIDVANDGSADWAGSLRIRCRGGSIVLDMADRLVSFDHPSRALAGEIAALAGSNPDSYPLPGKADYGHSHARQTADVITAILAQRAPLVTVADAAPATLLVLAAYHATATGRPATVGTDGPFQRPKL